ncbi:hypothetical protein J5N97_028175 [Dioscorea zingiberensis]|uniref:Uncharacterized protein n=1 Tax=Dioscorea zingiberensis TaxID=325984 RepID=A0A9D5BYJ6_9LILI|nr:hypothetical protein J5N97_028175 [Dioscorea zingiberensis]
MQGRMWEQSGFFLSGSRFSRSSSSAVATAADEDARAPLLLLRRYREGNLRKDGGLKAERHVAKRRLETHAVEHPYEKVRRFNVVVDDLLAVEVGKAGEHLPGDIKEGFRADEATVEGAAVHALEEDLYLVRAVFEPVALDDVVVIGGAEDVDLVADLAAYGVVVVPVDDLQGVDHLGGLMADHTHGAVGA